MNSLCYHPLVSFCLLLGISPLCAASYVPNLKGAIEIPFTMRSDGKATLGIYSEKGQLLRTVFQAVSLSKGPWLARWDGMDHWGKLLPVGSGYEARVYTHAGLKVTYEFNLAQGDWNQKNQPWLTQGYGGEGLDRRQGGWLSDHSGPRGIVAVGDKVLISSGAVEHGDGHIAIDLSGNKLWGRGGLGQVGPNEMYAQPDGSVLQLRLNSKKSRAQFQRFNPQDYSTQNLLSLGATSTMVAHAVGDSHLHVMVSDVNPNAKRKLIERDPLKIEYKESEPQILNKDTVQYQMSPQERFTSTFKTSGHFQVGSYPKIKGEVGYYLLPLTEPFRIGTLAHSRYPAAERIDLFALRSGTNYKASLHSPFEGGKRDESADLEDIFDDLDEDLGGDLSDLDGLHDDWIKVGSVVPAKQMNFTSSSLQRPMETRAILVRYELKSKNRAKKAELKVAKCTLWSSILDPHTATPTHLAPGLKGGPVNSWGWKYNSPTKVHNDSPATLILDYGKPIAMDALYTVNQLSAALAVDILSPGVTPASADESDWKEATVFKGYDKKYYGYYSSRTNYNIAPLSFSRRETSRYLRIRYFDGVGKSRIGLRWEPDDPFTLACGAFIPVTVRRDLVADSAVPKQLWKKFDLKSFAETSSVAVPPLECEDLAVFNDRDFYTVRKGVLYRSTIRGTAWEHLPVAGIKPRVKKIRRTGAWLGVSYGNLLQLVDPASGNVIHEIGDGKDYPARGPYYRDRLKAIGDWSLDKNNELWVVETSRHPKRVARFDLSGNCLYSITGGPEYGGGGYLDPSLKQFYYQGMEFSVDMVKAESHLTHFNDRIYTEETPTQEKGAFHYTTMGAPIQRDGRTYIVSPGGGSLAIMEEDRAWRPVAVMGSAHENFFLTNTKKWASHWKNQNLQDKRFLWVDRNEDGAYQIDEVTVFGGSPSGGHYWRSYIGRDLAVWSPQGRLAPSDFSALGVPLYDRANFQHRKDPYPQAYTGTQSWGSRAKPNPSGYGSFIVTDDGYQCFVGQPYVYGPDTTILGGVPDTSGEGDGFRPQVQGLLIEHTLQAVGRAKTQSQVGEIAVQNGNLGRWSVVGLKSGGLLLDQIFTGKEGSFSTDLKPVRGMDVTHRKFATETFFGNFTKANNGRYYIVAGKSYHALFELHGLDDIKTTRLPVEITTENRSANGRLRARLLADWMVSKTLTDEERIKSVKTLSNRFGRKGIKPDGRSDAWGGPPKMTPIDEPMTLTAPKARFYFDMAYSSEGLYIAYAGTSYIGSSAEAPVDAFKKGFALDFRYRTDMKSPASKKAKQKIEGDRRILFAPIKGIWSAVLFDFLKPGSVKKPQIFSSPWVTTSVDEVRLLNPSEAKVSFLEFGWGGIDDNFDEDFDVDEDFDGDEGVEGNDLDDRTSWSAEVFITWEALGFDGPPPSFKGDVGVLIPDSGGARVDERQHWALPGMKQTVSDVGVEADIRPGKWGTFDLNPN